VNQPTTRECIWLILTTCGTFKFAMILLSGNAAIVSPEPYCSICSTCWHPSGDSTRPDWTECGTSIGDYGIFVRFSPAWKAHCLGVLGFQSISSAQPNPSTLDKHR